MCERAGFGVDSFGRVFYPNLGLFRIEVIDTNNNPITTFGKYGNEAPPAGASRLPGQRTSRQSICLFRRHGEPPRGARQTGVRRECRLRGASGYFYFGSDSNSFLKRSSPRRDSRSSSDISRPSVVIPLPARVSDSNAWPRYRSCSLASLVAPAASA